MSDLKYEMVSPDYDEWMELTDKVYNEYPPGESDVVFDWVLEDVAVELFFDGKHLELDPDILSDWRDDYADMDSMRVESDRAWYE